MNQYIKHSWKMEDQNVFISVMLPGVCSCVCGIFMEIPFETFRKILNDR